MIKAKHNYFIVQFFNWYISYILKKDFFEIKYDSLFYFEENKSILCISNHFSWWDGFFSYYINLKLFKKNFYVMMLEKELEKRKLFTSIGAYSINPKSESTKESIEYTNYLLEKKETFVSIFPQGRIESNHKNKIKLRKGIEYIINNSNNDFQFIFSVVLVDFFEKRKPTAYIYLKKIVLEKNVKIEQIQEEYNLFYLECKNKQNELCV